MPCEGLEYTMGGVGGLWEGLEYHGKGLEYHEWGWSTMGGVGVLGERLEYHGGDGGSSAMGMVG